MKRDTIASRKLPADFTEMWTCKDISEHFGRSVKTIGYIVRSRAIAAVARIGAKKLFDMEAVELVALGLAEIEAITGVCDRLDRLELLEHEVSLDLRKYRNNPEMLAVLERQCDNLRMVRAVIESTDRRVNLQPVK